MRPFALCFTGISGSGKTTLANAVAERLRADGVPIQVLDGDVLLSMFNAEGEFVEQAIEGFCDSFSRPEKYTYPSYM